MARDELTIRAARTEDAAGIAALLRASFDWVPDGMHDRFFRWKHDENPFGASRTWVAVDGDSVVGLRTFLSWEFLDGGRVVRAVRAVDTATHPDHRGRGIFTRLTLDSLGPLRDDGVEFVFNVPNDQSRPGYLKMGWVPVGRLPTLLRPLGWRSLSTLIAARANAGDVWSVAGGAGEPAADVLADEDAVASLLASQPSPERLRTNRSPRYLRWRYGYEPLDYRAVVHPQGPVRGIVVFRRRGRGPATEVTVTEVLAQDGDPSVAAALLRRLIGEVRGDVALRLAGDGGPRAGFLPAIGQGPILVWRDLRAIEPPPLEHWQLSLGDVELL